MECACDANLQECENESTNARLPGQKRLHYVHTIRTGHIPTGPGQLDAFHDRSNLNATLRAGANKLFRGLCCHLKQNYDTDVLCQHGSPNFDFFLSCIQSLTTLLGIPG